MAQVHKKFSDSQVKEMIARYLAKEIKREHIQTVLGIKRRRFCELVKQYRDNPDTFSVEYKRKTPSRVIADDVEENIIIELSKEKNLIDDHAIPIRNYNYSYIKDILEEKYTNKVSLPTIISRAKKYNFYINKPKKQKAHDREVLKDIFALRANRIIDPYRKISINNFEIKLKEKPRDYVNMRIYPLNKEFSEVRFWCNDKLIEVKEIRNSDLRVVHF